MENHLYDSFRREEHSDDAIIRLTKNWIKQMVIDLNLCPFAFSVYQKNRIRYILSREKESQELLDLVYQEILLLLDSEEISTSLIILPSLESFEKFLDFISIVYVFLKSSGLEYDIQIAHFHHEYQFADTEIEEISNYTNRSPYPILQLLKITEVSEAIDSYGDTESIPIKNQEKLRNMGRDELRRIYALIFDLS